MAFEPLPTDRLTLRRPTIDDLDELTARRSEPEVARYQAWNAPYPADRARELLADVVQHDGPRQGQWWMITVERTDDLAVLGDVAVWLSDDGKVAEIGYTFASRYWGNGYATEAVTAVVDWLFSGLGVGRIRGTVDAGNGPSARVLERTGFIYEGETKASFWPEPTDDDPDPEPGDEVVYGLTEPDWRAWLARPTDPPTDVELIEINYDNQRAVMRLATHKSQDGLVAPVAFSYGDALFPYESDGVTVEPELRAIEADGELAGFVMFARSTPRHDEPYLWRLLIDRTHQRRGIGYRAVERLVDLLRGAGETTLFVTWFGGPGGPQPFYLKQGFEPTGAKPDGEVEGRLSLDHYRRP